MKLFRLWLHTRRTIDDIINICVRHNQFVVDMKNICAAATRSAAATGKTTTATTTTYTATTSTNTYNNNNNNFHGATALVASFSSF